MNCSLLKKRAGRADGASGVGLKKMELGGLARTACHEVPLRPHYVMLGVKLERRKFGDWYRRPKLNTRPIDAGTRAGGCDYGSDGTTFFAQNRAIALRRASGVPQFAITRSAWRRFSSGGHWAASRSSKS